MVLIFKQILGLSVDVGVSGKWQGWRRRLEDRGGETVLRDGGGVSV